METFRDIIDIVNTKQGFAATVGNFDGCHMGHREILNRVVREAKNLNAASLVTTFEPHPIKILAPQNPFKNIFPVEDKLTQFEKLGFDAALVAPFSRELSSLEPGEFFDRFIKNIGVKHLFVGHDFSFGKNRSGTLQVLRGLCETAKVKLTVVEAVEFEGKVVSSSRIRECVEQGDVRKASMMLTRPYYMSGVVEKGAGRGKKLGFPTANLFTQAELFPRFGVYATFTRLKNTWFKSLTNVGVNPTFEGTNRRSIQVETFILDFDEDIYGETLQVHFVEFLRSEMKFKSVDDLIAQMTDDVVQARGLTWPHSPS